MCGECFGASLLDVWCPAIREGLESCFKGADA